MHLEELAVRWARRAVAGSSDGDLLELAREDLRETRLGVRDAREALELAPRALVGRILGEELRGRLERGGVVLLLLLVHLREAPQELTPLVGILARVEARLERRHHAAPVEAREVHRLEHLRCARAVLAPGHEGLERGHRVRVLRIDLESRRVLVEGAVDLVHPSLEHVAERVMERGLALVRRAGRSDLPLVERRRGPPIARRRA